MGKQIDDIVLGAIVFLNSILRAYLMLLWGAARMRLLRTAVRLRAMQMSSRPFSISGPALLVVTCIVVTLVFRPFLEIGRVWTATDEFVPPSINQLLLSAAILYYALDLFVTSFVGVRFGRRRGEAERRRRAQRLDILRYFCAGLLLLVALLVLPFSPVSLVYANVSFSQVQLPAMVVGLLVSPLVPILAGLIAFPRLRPLLGRPVAWAMAVAFPLFLGAGLGAEIALTAPFFKADEKVERVALACRVQPDGTLAVEALFRNPGASWYYLDPDGFTVKLKTSKERGHLFDADPRWNETIDGTSLTYVGATGPRSLIPLPPHGTAMFAWRAAAQDTARLAAAAAALPYPQWPRCDLSDRSGLSWHRAEGPEASATVGWLGTFELPHAPR